MTTINDVSDLIRILNESPEWRQAVRGAILGEEFSRLPEQLAAFIDATNKNFEAVNQQFQVVNQRLDRLETDVAELKADMVEVKTDVAELKTGMAELQRGQNRLAGRMDRGLGLNYEFRVGNSIHSLANRYLDLGQTRLLHGARADYHTQFLNSLSVARNHGLISARQFGEILELDLVLAARRQSDGSPVHVAAEVSITIDDSDIERAARRGEMLSAAVNQTVIPVVIGVNIAQERANLAGQSGVTVMVQPED